MPLKVPLVKTRGASGCLRVLPAALRRRNVLRKRERLGERCTYVRPVGCVAVPVNTSKFTGCRAGSIGFSMKAKLLISAVAWVAALTPCFAADFGLRKLSDTEVNQGVPYILAEYGFPKLGYYEFRDGITVLQLVAFLGGILPETGGDSVKVLRNRKAISVSIRQALDDASRDVVLRPADRVIAPTQGCFGGGLTTEELALLNKRLLAKFEER